MFNLTNAKQYCKEDISLVENYDKAIADTSMWVIHHRDEIRILPSGMVALRSKNDLIENGRYWKCPANELIFMKFEEHKALHNKYMNERPEVKESHKKAFENTPGMHREHWTEEEKIKLQHKGVPMPKKRARSPFVLKYGMTKRELADKYNIPVGSMNWYMQSGKLEELISKEK